MRFFSLFRIFTIPSFYGRMIVTLLCLKGENYNEQKYIGLFDLLIFR